MRVSLSYKEKQLFFVFDTEEHVTLLYIYIYIYKESLSDKDKSTQYSNISLVKYLLIVYKIPLVLFRLVALDPLAVPV
jgi:hypothetical protein